MNRSSYKGQYDQIVEPEMIAFHADFGPTTTRVVVEFVDLHSDQGSQTKVVLTQVGFPTQDIFNGVSQGTHEAFDKLDSLLARIALAALVGFVAYFVVGFATFGLLPSLRSEFLKYQTVYRSQEAMKSVMPVGMAFMFFAIVPLAILYAMLCQGVSGFAEGARLGALFGALIGVFAIGSFVVHNYVNLQIGLKLTVQQAVVYFVEWVVVGIVIGFIYRPLSPHYCSLHKECNSLAQKRGQPGLQYAAAQFPG